MTGRREFLRISGVGMAGRLTASAALRGQQPAEANGEDAVHSSFRVRAFGATGDGKKLDTAAINHAIETAANAGGGTVHFQAGQYLCIRFTSRAMWRFISIRAR